MPPESVMILLSFLSHSDRLFSTLAMCAGLAGLPNRPRLKLAVAHTVSKASVVSSCGTRPISERAARKSLMMSWPSTVTVPPLGLTMPQMMLISVVLPAPLGPSSAKISPRRISRSMLFERVEARRVGLGEIGDGDDRGHGTPMAACGSWQVGLGVVRGQWEGGKVGAIHERPV